MFNVSLPSLSRMGFFSRWKCGITQNPNMRKVKNKDLVGQQKKKSYKARQGHIQHVYKNPSPISLKRRVTLDPEGIWGHELEPSLCCNRFLVGLRCRLSPSPATGLVGMEENTFLSDYFACVGFLPFTSQRCGYQNF